MMLSVMVVGAGAAFSDQSKIKNTEAVDMCTALNIIGGYPDGTFKPEGNITRAEVTKMICVALNGGKEPNVGTNATPTFSDVRTNPNSAWAEGYIESCYAQGIVSGVGGGKFAPAGNVTATQMAKMLLVALGYNADNEGFTGNAWATNVNVRASQKGLYEDLENIDVNAALTRDNAAQMIWNALNAYEVEYKTTLITDSKGQLTSQITVQDKQVQGNDGFVKITLLEDKYESKTATGILTHIEWNDTDKEYKYTIGEDVKNGNVTTPAPTFQSASDFSDLFGMNVKVVYTKDKKSNDIKVFGIVPKDSKILAKGIMDDIEYSDTKEIKVDGTKYKTDEAVSSLKAQAFNGGEVALFSGKAVTSTLKPYYTVNVIDNDNDGKVDVVVYLPVTVAKVTYAGSSSITAGKSYKYADENIADGIKKDDYVVIVDKANTKDEKYSITKAEMITGKIEAIKGTDVKVDGTWYKTIDGAQEDSYSLNDEFTLAVVNGFVCHAEESDGVISNDKVILVTKADDAKTSGINAGTQKIKALFSDGTEKEITVAQLWNSASSKYVDMGTSVSVSVNTLYTFTTKSNGEYKLKAIDDTKYDAAMSTITKVDDGKATGSIDSQAGKTMRFADTAAIFVVPGNGDDAKVITGKALGTWKNITDITSASSYLYGKKDGGIVYANLGVIVMGNQSAAPSSGDVQYGFVTADSAVVKEGDDYYVSMTIWNGTSEVTVKADSYYEYNGSAFTAKTDVDEDTNVKNYTSSGTSYTVAFAKQTPISYKTTGDGVISEVRPLNVAPTSSEYLGAVAVTGYQDGKKYVSINGTDYDLTSDTVQMFVDTDAKKGSTSGSITEANEVHGYFVKNAYVVLNTAKDEVEFILVDTQNNLNINTTEGDISVTTTTNVTAVDNDKMTLTIATGNVNDTVATWVKNATTGEAEVVVKGTADNNTKIQSGDHIYIIAGNGDIVDYTVK